MTVFKAILRTIRFPASVCNWNFVCHAFNLSCCWFAAFCFITGINITFPNKCHIPFVFHESFDIVDFFILWCINWCVGFFEHLSPELTIYNWSTSTEFQHTEVIRIVIDVSKSHKVNGCVLSEKLRHFHFCLPSQWGLAVIEKIYLLSWSKLHYGIVLLLWKVTKFVTFEEMAKDCWIFGKNVLKSMTCHLVGGKWKKESFSLFYWHTMISVSCILFIYYVNLVSCCMWFVRCMLLNL